MKQKMTFFALAGKWVAAVASFEKRPFRASQPKPAEACWRKPRRVCADAIEPGQWWCFIGQR